MAKFHKFKTACMPREYIEAVMENPEAANQIEFEVEYKELPVRLSAIIYYFPLKNLKFGSISASKEDYLKDEELFLYAEFVNVVLVDGTEITIKCHIVEFEEILNSEN